MTTIIIFDVDHTLLHSAGAGTRAMNRTFAQLFDIEDAFASVDFAGRTDLAILRDCFTRHAMLDDAYEERAQRFRAAYPTALDEELSAGSGVLMPGVVPLLAALQAMPGVRLGLGTGNLREAAELKLRRHGLWEYFLDGGFADDSEDRAEVIAAAIRRLRADDDGDPVAIFVVGDTPHDIAAAQANGAIALGVATGSSRREALTEAGADHVFETLEDIDAFLRLLEPA